MTTGAAMRWRVTLCSIRDEPIAVAPSPYRMKIVEKLAMKSRLGTRTRRTPALEISFGETPTTVEM
jgi:hypothetical protein